VKKEDFAKLRAREAEYETKAARLMAELEAAEAGQAGLDAAALRAEVLGEAGAKAAKADAEKNAAAVRVAKDELARTKQGLAILADEKQKITAAVVDEIRAEYRAKYGRALKDTFSKLSAAEVAKDELARIQDAANMAARDCGIFATIHLQPQGVPLFLERDFVAEFAAREKMNGYDI
jgi:hypothetical protein